MCKSLISSWIRFWMLSPIKKIQVIVEVVFFLFLYIISLLPAWFLWGFLWEKLISGKLYQSSDDLGFIPVPLLLVKHVYVTTDINCKSESYPIDCYLNGMNEFTLTVIHDLFFIGMVATAFLLAILMIKTIMKT